MKRRWLAGLLCWIMIWPAVGITEDDDELQVEEIVENVVLDEDNVEIHEEIQPENEPVVENEARKDFIDRIIALGKELYDKADGKRKRAHYASDIYVCKNFTVYLFRQNRDDFRMAEFPNTPLVIPNNLPAAKCKPYAYGFLWEDISAEKGNPFEAAAQFIYDTNLSKEENLEKAMDFMRQARRGDYFQMSADYEYGVGAHSAIMLDYDPENGLVQFDEVKSVEWWAKAFCHKKRGATLYRLRDDIIYAGE